MRRIRQAGRWHGAVAAVALVLVAGGARGGPASTAADEGQRRDASRTGLGPKTIPTETLRLTGRRFVFSPKTAASRRW